MHINSKSQNTLHFLECRELGYRVSPNSFREQRLIKNISRNCFIKTGCIGNERDYIIAFDVQDFLAATLTSENTVKLWNLKTRRCLWIFEVEPKKIHRGILKIVEDRIVTHDFSDTIQLIDLKLGNEIGAITSPNLLAKGICTIGRKIFCLFGENYIGEWNLEGRFVRYIVLDTTFNEEIQFLGSGNFLVYISKQTILIHNIQSNSQRKIVLRDTSMMRCVRNVSIQDNLLLCEFGLEQTKPECCVIDLESGSVINHYKATVPTAYNYSFKKNPFLLDPGLVSHVILNREWAYLGYVNGKIAAINLIKKTYTILDESHVNPIQYLAIKGDILISGSRFLFEHLAEIKFWDIRSMKKVAEIKIPSLFKISLITGKIFAASWNSLMQWEYLACGEEAVHTNCFFQ